MKNTQKGFIVPLAIILVLAISGGGAWYAKTHSNANKTNSDKLVPPQETGAGIENNTNASAKADANVSVKAEVKATASADVKLNNGRFNGSISELSKSGKSYECTIVTTVMGVKTDGKVFVSGEKVRGDFNSTIPQFGSVASHMIADMTSVYTWTSMTSQGFITAKTKSTASASGATSGGQSFDYNGRYDYACKEVTPDASIFTPPASVTFKKL